MTTRAEQIAIRILANEPLEVRSLTQDWIRSGPLFTNEPPPESLDECVRVIAAGVIELLADRHAQRHPAWTASIGALSEGIYLVDAAKHSPKMRMRVERESPEPLRKRNVFAPPGYLEML